MNIFGFCCNKLKLMCKMVFHCQIFMLMDTIALIFEKNLDHMNLYGSTIWNLTNPHDWIIWTFICVELQLENIPEYTWIDFFLLFPCLRYPLPVSLILTPQLYPGLRIVLRLGRRIFCSINTHQGKSFDFSVSVLCILQIWSLFKACEM